MSYPKKLLRMAPTQGIVFDTPASELPPNVYTNGENIQFRSPYPSKILGTRTAYGSVNEAYALLSLDVEGVRYWLYFGIDTVGAVQTTVHSDITPAGIQPVAAPWQWSVGSLNGVAFGNNTFDAPVFWDGVPANPMQRLPDWPLGFTTSKMIAHRFHLFALGTDQPAGPFPNKVMWSDAAPPGAIPDTWTAGPDNQAGDFELSDSPGGILSGLTLSDSLIVYKNSSTYIIEYVGGNFIYIRRKLFSQSGILNPRCVASGNRRHFVLTESDIIVHDGSSIQSIAEQRTRDFLFQQLDQQNFRNAFLVYYRPQKELWVCIPESGNTFCNLALVYSTAFDSWGIRDLLPTASAAMGVVNDQQQEDSWDSDAESWDSDITIWNQTSVSLAQESLVLGHPISMMLEQIDSVNNPSSSLARLQRDDLTFGEAERIKFVRRVHVRARDNFTQMRIRIGSKMHLNDAVQWSPFVDITEPQQIVNSFAQGRYISFEARSVDNHFFEPIAFDIEAELRGYF